MHNYTNLVKIVLSFYIFLVIILLSNFASAQTGSDTALLNIILLTHDPYPSPEMFIVSLFDINGTIIEKFTGSSVGTNLALPIGVYMIKSSASPINALYNSTFIGDCRQFGPDIAKVVLNDNNPKNCTITKNYQS